MKVTRADVLWNYGATFMRVASALIVLPLILRMLPQEEVGLWSVMIGLNSMIYLLDFGFFQTFSRAVTYIYSGATKLEKEGFTPVRENKGVSYPLLKGLLKAMSHFYGLLAATLLVLLFTGGVWYIEQLMEGFTGDANAARIAWYSYGILLCYQFFTYYYDAALVGRGMIKRSRQIIVFSQSVHIVISSLLLISGLGIISMVIGQSVATMINRYLARRAFYDAETRDNLRNLQYYNWKSIIKTLFNTAYKNGLASLSWIFTNRMLAILGALFIPLTTMASYGITKQITDITITLSAVWFATYYPKLTGEQIKKSISEVKRIFIKAQIIAIIIFLCVTIFVVFAGAPALEYIGSSTQLLPIGLMLLLFFASLLESLTQLSTSVLLSRNEVPHYKAQSITALIALLLMFAALKYSDAGILALIAIPLVVQLLYQHWRWTTKLWKELEIKLSDYLDGIKSVYKSIPVLNNNK
ncbi:MAG: O-unit flippase-like protein [Bacteroidales bacterium]|nr:O-unit flippase-like protein [Bacteroidales bacterium]